MKYSFLILVTLCFFSAIPLIAQDTLGDIKYSILEPTVFKTLHPGWILADGSDIQDSRLYELTKIKNAPDARGLFLRGMNMNRDKDSGDAQGNRDICSYQSDEIKKHVHSIGGPATTGDIIGGDINFFNEPVRRKTPSSTESTGGDESRPRNIAVYIYIKIN